MKDQLRFDIVEDKPLYRLPSMEEVRSIPLNGMKVVSTFSGCGGSCLGFRMAGFKVVWASEFVPAAAETYEANWPDTILDRRDIREVKPEEILKATGLAVGELDVFEGSPPCSSFSLAGNREDGYHALEGGVLDGQPIERVKRGGEVKKYSDVEQRTDDLFYEYARLLKGLMPRAFVAENVPALMMGEAIWVLRDFLKTLEMGGEYKVDARVLNAARFGVPQMRRRLIFVGVRRDLGRPPAYPTPLDYTYSIRDALGDVRVTGTETMVERRNRTGFGQSTLVDGEGFDSDRPVPTLTVEGFAGGNKYEFEVGEPVDESAWSENTRTLTPDPDAPAPTIQAAGMGDAKMSQVSLEELEEISIEGYAIGNEWDKLEPEQNVSDEASTSRYFNLVRPDPDAPVPTITQTGGTLGAASVTHPTQKRKFTIAELRLLSGFPADFVLTGSWGQQWERIGRAVPPPLMAAVARTLRDEVLRG